MLESTIKQRNSPLTKRRMGIGLTLKQTAERADGSISAQRVHDWEAWAADPGKPGALSLWNSRAFSALAYAHALGLSLDGLMRLVPVDPRVADVAILGGDEPPVVDVADGNGVTFREIVACAGLTGSGLAARMGVSKQNVTRWMRWGDAVPSAYALDPARMNVVSLVRVAAVLGLSLDELETRLLAGRHAELA